MKQFITNSRYENISIDEHAPRLKLFFLYEILCKYTDDETGMTFEQIKSKLEKDFGVTMERKSFYKSIEALSFLDDAEIQVRKSNTTTYHFIRQNFQMPEIKLLVDILQSANFITDKKTKTLIGKIKSLCSYNNANKLQRQINISDRIKTTNEQIYYSIDNIYSAITEGFKIKFDYIKYGIGSDRKISKNISSRIVSPMSLMWNDENYYLIAVENDVLKHYRVDKMIKTEILENITREHTELFKYEDMANYQKKVFSMYSGKTKNVEIKFSNDLIGVVIDRFGEDILLRKTTETSFNIYVDIEISPLFFGWLSSFGSRASIVSPQETKNDYINHLKTILDAQ